MSTPHDKGFRRNSILVTLAGVSPDTLSESALQHSIQANGYPKLSADELSQDLDYLQDKGLVASSQAKLNVAQTRWKLTAAGREHLEASGFLD